ncbi:LytR family transcriptional regulator [Streptacidiphilus pinicola]|uniref:LytR family transcriptional regulator n=1 Tax=Streptacidiphilus pinicola TaxID=2219663 RepID=A0A2X0KKM1_9ACTN|nr:LCP family protein [Streptacidiphilus pinicola]RAG87499.1 LytR family transcriptional regulator [Streptacidiphilus pinicola]
MDGGTGPPSVVGSGERSTGRPAGGPVGGGDGRRRRLAFWLSLGLGTMLLLAVGTVWLGYTKLNGNIHADTLTDRLLGPGSSRPTQVNSAQNILIIGSDSRAGANAVYGAAVGARSDTTILLHIAGDRRRAVAVSLPRDAVVDVPACTLPNGTVDPAYTGIFDSAFEKGGTACTIRTVERLTDIRIDHFVVADFTGFKKMVDAVGGVEVCLAQPVVDKDAELDLPAGRQTLDGEQALGFVRARYALGDGSDTQRMGRQQDFLSSLVRKVDSSGVLLNPTRLYPLLDAATSALTVDPGLDSLSKLYDLTSSLSNLPAGRVTFLTAPREPYAHDRNRDQLKQPEADELFRQLRDDVPVTVAAAPTAPPSPGPVNANAAAALGPALGSTAGSTVASPAPRYSGRTAAQEVCAAP